MCVIIHRSVGSPEISQKILFNIIRDNPDGWGISFLSPKTGEILIIRGMDMEVFSSKVRELEELDLEFISHVRKATSGKKCIENTHPFKFNGGVLFHNGTFKIHHTNNNMSDTWHFTRKFNKYFNKSVKTGHTSQVSIIYAINKLKKYINGSRLAIMLNDGSVYLFGNWHEKNKNMFSKYVYEYSSYDNWLSDDYQIGHNHERKYAVKREYYSDSALMNNQSDIIKRLRNKTATVTLSQLSSLSAQTIHNLVRAFPKEIARVIYKEVTMEFEYYG